jgi:hypothetical protein
MHGATIKIKIKIKINNSFPHIFTDSFPSGVPPLVIIVLDYYYYYYYLLRDKQ